MKPNQTIVLICIAGILMISTIVVSVVFVAKKDKESAPKTVTSTATTTTGTDTLRYLSLNCSRSNVFGIYNTSLKGNSREAKPGKGIGSYPKDEQPYNGCDNYIFTKYVNFGHCYENIPMKGMCGSNSGFYLTPTGKSFNIIGFRMCTADDYPSRDPIQISIEGSNASNTQLVFGSSWTLIYLGDSGLYPNPGRSKCGYNVNFKNTMMFHSYRLLVLEIRSASTCTQFSEFQMIAD